MPRPADKTSSPGTDALQWFFRLDRAVHEGDFELASLAQDTLYQLGWRIAHRSQRTFKDDPGDRQRGSRKGGS
jgi:hypothetical protein